GVVQHIGLRATRRQLGAQPLTEREMLEVEGEVDGQPFAPRPVVDWPLVQRRVVVSIMVPKLHVQSVASSRAMGYGRHRNDKVAGKSSQTHRDIRLSGAVHRERRSPTT